MSVRSNPSTGFHAASSKIADTRGDSFTSRSIFPGRQVRRTGREPSRGLAFVAMAPVRALSVVLLAGGLTVGGVIPQAVAAPIPDPALRGPSAPAHVDGDHTVPVYSYADAIRESVKVDTTKNTDSDAPRA